MYFSLYIEPILAEHELCFWKSLCLANLRTTRKIMVWGMCKKIYLCFHDKTSLLHTINIGICCQ